MTRDELIDQIARMEPTQDADDAVSTVNRLIAEARAIVGDVLANQVCQDCGGALQDPNNWCCDDCLDSPSEPEDGGSCSAMVRPFDSSKTSRHT